MIPVSRAIRYYHPPTFPHCSLRPPYKPSSIQNRIGSTRRKAFLSKRQPQDPRFKYPQRSAIDPFTLLLAVAVSSGLAYIAATYSSRDTIPEAGLESESDAKEVLVLNAHQFPLTMAPSMPPGRPGNLSSDQEAKLKEMWISLLEIFGVTHEERANRNSTGSLEPTPDGKKRKKSRLSIFHKKDKNDSETNSLADGENDKHGQTQEFKHALASLSPDQLREAFWSMSKHDHPDALLLRFLRARKWDVQAALVMMVSTLHWRMQEQKVDEDIMKNGEGGALRETKSSNSAEKKEGEDFMAQLRMGKSFLHGTDKDGRPCCYVRVRLHKQGEQSERSLERYTVYTIETARMMLRPPVDTAVRSSLSVKLSQIFMLTWDDRQSYST